MRPSQRVHHLATNSPAPRPDAALPSTPPADSQQGVEVLHYYNRHKPNGEVVALPRGSGGGLMVFPSVKGLFLNGKDSTRASKFNIGPKSLEGAYRAGYAKALYGPWWWVPPRVVKTGAAAMQGQRKEG
jgi:hypothetical protein